MVLYFAFEKCVDAIDLSEVHALSEPVNTRIHLAKYFTYQPR